LKVVSVIGTKKSGKTTTTENLISELSKLGYKVAAIKHVPERDFTLDTPGKDTYRFAQHGAKTIVAFSAKEITTIEKVPAETVPFEKLMEKCRGNDIVLVEGLKQIMAKNKDIPKISIVKTQEEALNAKKAYEPILAFSGPYDTQNLFPETPYINALTEPEKLATLIEEKILKK
jgi:molybdopterin-guanine dinucleotide biosynthesis protein B